MTTTPSDPATPPKPAESTIGAQVVPGSQAVPAAQPAPSAQPAPAAQVAPADDPFRIDVDRIRVGEFAAPDEGRHHPKGRFYRPELYSTSEKIGSSTALKFALIVVLLGVAGALIALAAGSGIIL